MKRFIVNDLREWRTAKRRKPLIVKGARQVGKTWVLQEFGKEFPDGYAYFNFDKQEEYKQFFKTSKDTGRILQNLSMASGQRITKDTLVIFDEIQECPEALNALKYFCEDAPEQPVACAGSLLGLHLSKGFPVGKTDFLSMGPMTFSEYLIATGKDNLYQYIQGIDRIEPIPDAFFNPLQESMKQYFITGGMPEAVAVWAEEADIVEMEKVQSMILDSYEYDFGKHAPVQIVPKIGLIWHSIPSQLSRENRKFLYSVVKTGARAREYEEALNWLCGADLLHKVYRITKAGLPVSAYDDLSAFKIYMGDVGLLRRHSHLSYSAFAEGNRLFTEFKGALTENYILQSLQRIPDAVIRYWSENPGYEIDFVLEMDNQIYPIEVKAGTNIRSASLKKYRGRFADATPLAVRFSLRNLFLDEGVLNIPLFLADRLPQLLRMV